MPSQTTAATKTYRDLATRSGVRLHVRPAGPADKPALAEFFRNVSREDLRFRFLSAVREVGDERLVEMTEVDHVRTDDFLAFGDDGQTVLAAAMLAANPSLERAEVAISVRADLKGRGIGWSLLEFVSDEAKARGIKVLESVESRENQAAIQLEREMGFIAEPAAGDPTLMVVRKKLN